MREPRIKDLTGLSFGKLTVKELAGFHVKPSGKRTAKWLCICDCGNHHITQGSILQAGDCNSCGCLISVKSTKSVKPTKIRKPKKNKDLSNKQKKRRISKKLPRFKYLHNLPIIMKSDKEIYCVWNGIRQRVGISLAYLDCTISDNFKNFEFFLSWYRNQYGYNLGWEIDKDLLVKGNREYGENTCTLLPREINLALSSQKSSRGELPRGVNSEKAKNNYLARCSVGQNKQVNLGRYSTPEEAFMVYKQFKELVLKSLAFKYKKWLDPKAYQALMDYEIDIDS